MTAFRESIVDGPLSVLQCAPHHSPRFSEPAFAKTGVDVSAGAEDHHAQRWAQPWHGTRAGATPWLFLYTMWKAKPLFEP
jgi:hypothetical protein